ncbi:tRNA 2-thiouridine(34) synthase MnmA [Eubacterium sp. 1001713B170207_170306_E7]|uniref:tRNA 2-thiouridine(34) synthase MnmA n=1 Tax=Eubacterium sp. 1001713B170207_170306_E7 TaxID=2787097 RepID=UPI00189B22DE|nr:tRNA 2-thiouridine(34) synthase MnmA [Eubacterium sp. 1001713B170207_170306_E7]
MKNRKVILGFSGGVDSAAAALILKNKGYEVLGVTFDFFGDETLLEKAGALARKIGIRHEYVDKRQDFREKVIDPFIAGYLKGYTPNPCVRCDAVMKFNGLLDYADREGAVQIATGHYLKLERSHGHIRIKVSDDPRKDQSYYLYTLNQACLKRLIFPLSAFKSKDAVRAYLNEQGIGISKSEESQGICFIPDGNYGRFIKKEIPLMPEGRFRDRFGSILGTHNGFYHYTVGQKRGIPLLSGKKYVVTALRPESNEVILGEEAELYQKRIFLKALHFIEGRLYAGKVQFKICRWGYLYSGTLFLSDAHRGYLECDERVRAPMPGQAAVFYDGDTLLGGGTIDYK